MQTYGKGPAVVYATLTDSRPNEAFRFLTVGYVIFGPAVIRFRHLANDQNDIQQVLNVVQMAMPLDTLQSWAWRLTDYKIVCEQRYPAYKIANEAAFASSIFASVDSPG